MLKIFGGRAPDHPMADARDARRILEELPAQEAKALEELAHWHESVAAAEGFKPAQRFQLAVLIDEAAQPRVRKLARDYFAAERPSRFQEAQMWGRIHVYWRQAGQAYAQCVESSLKGADLGKGAAAVLAVRALRALAQQLKWQQLRYGPIDAALWGLLNRVYAFAELHGVAEAKTEFLRAVMFGAASPDSLLPSEIELAERLIGELAPGFALATAPAPELPFWTDLVQAMAPQRALTPPPQTKGVRFFGNPVSLEGRIERSRDTELDVLRHLAACWAREPRQRQHPRHKVKTRLTIAHGFEGVLEALGGGDSLNFDRSATESWIVENVSNGGFGALVPQMKSDWVRVGALLALQPEGGDNWLVGTVRRVNRVSQHEARVGVQTLSKTPLVSRFEMRGMGNKNGIVLDGGAIALPAGVYVQGMNLEAERAGRQHVYMPQGVAQRGEDYEIVRFREMIRES
jgi:hypothetical protein